MCMQCLNGNKQFYFQAGKGFCIYGVFLNKITYLFGLFVCFVVVDLVGFFLMGSLGRLLYEEILIEN